MKRMVLAIGFIAGVFAVAQSQPDDRERWACVTGNNCAQTRGADPSAQKIARVAKVGRWWIEGKGAIVATFAADRIDASGDVFHLRGNVEIATATLVLTADEAEYHWDTGETEARGNVRVKPDPDASLHAISQFGIK